MKKLVILKACANSGKTGTLSALIAKLLADTNFNLIHPVAPEEVTSFIIGKIGTKRIGVITFGDPGSDEDLAECLNECNSQGCEIIFTASRTKGGIYNYLYSFASKHNFVTVETSPLFAWRFRDTGIDITKLHDIFADMLYKLI